MSAYTSETAILGEIQLKDLIALTDDAPRMGKVNQTVLNQVIQRGRRADADDDAGLGDRVKNVDSASARLGDRIQSGDSFNVDDAFRGSDEVLHHTDEVRAAGKNLRVIERGS